MPPVQGKGKVHPCLHLRHLVVRGHLATLGIGLSSFTVFDAAVLELLHAKVFFNYLLLLLQLLVLLVL